MENIMELPKYRSHKEVRAAKIVNVTKDWPDDGHRCEICNEPMPASESMFRFHGYSGPCPKPPIKRTYTLHLDGGTTRRLDEEWFIKHATWMSDDQGKPTTTPLVVGGYFVEYADGYTSFSPRKAFEDGYTQIASA